MGNLIPFFYYDILSRITPGAFTLATLLLIRDRLPDSWHSFLSGSLGWQAVLVPIVLGGLSYVIGLIYEVFDHSWPFRWAVELMESRAFHAEWETFGENHANNKEIPKLASISVEIQFRKQLWEKLVLLGGKDERLDKAFAHCHRFQAEYKMFQHFEYASIVFASLSFYTRLYWQGALALVVVIPFFMHCAQRRNGRRWAQVLSFSQQLDIL
jgi:hypothetical protein